MDSEAGLRIFQRRPDSGAHAPGAEQQRKVLRSDFAVPVEVAGTAGRTVLAGAVRKPDPAESGAVVAAHDEAALGHAAGADLGAGAARVGRGGSSG